MSASLEQLTAEFSELIGPVAAVPAEAPAAPAPAASPAPAAATPTTAGKPPAAAPTAAAPVAPPKPIQSVDHALKGYHFDATVAPAQVVAAAGILDRAGFALDTITGVDWIAQEQMEVVYDFFHPTSPLRAVVRTRVSRADPELPTILGVFPGANWHEREAHDFFGLRFTGHPNLKPFLLPEDADFHPLRKDYKP
jgi:NADH-quinone oxidoreductase subunit C